MGKGLGGLSAGPASPRSSSCWPARWRVYCKENQGKYKAWKTPVPDPRLWKAPNDDEHALNPKSFVTVASVQEKEKKKGANFRQWREGAQEKRCAWRQRRGFAGCREGTRPPSLWIKDGLKTGLWLLCSASGLGSGATQLCSIFFLKGLRLSHFQSLWACLSP